MEINLKYFTMKSFIPYNIEHLKALEKIKQDNEINKYFKNLSFVFNEPNYGYQFPENYLVYFCGINIGFIRLIEEGETVEIQYGIFEEFRNRKLSIALLKEVVEELKKYPIDKLVLYIKENNMPSIKSANKVGFEVEKEDSDILVYSKKMRQNNG